MTSPSSFLVVRMLLTATAAGTVGQDSLSTDVNCVKMSFPVSRRGRFNALSSLVGVGTSVDSTKASLVQNFWQQISTYTRA